MKYKNLFPLFAMIWTSVHAQTDLNTTSQRNLYVELGGSACQYSINYEQFITPKIAVRAGVEVFPYRVLDLKNTFYAVPVTCSYLYGKRNSKLELGGGFLLGVRHSSYWSYGTFTKMIFDLTGIVGYRYQRPGRGFMFRAGVTPFLAFVDNDVPFARRGLSLFPALSFGYSF